MEGGIAPAGAKVTGATIRMWLLNKFISFLAVLSWKTGLKENVDNVTSFLFEQNIFLFDLYIVHRHTM